MVWVNLPTQANGIVINATNWNDLVGDILQLGGADGDTHAGNWNCTGNGYFAGGVLTVGASASASGQIRLANNAYIGWRNGGGTGDLSLQADSANRLVLSGAGGSWNTTSSVGAAGGASALPATPNTYLQIVLNGNALRIPCYS